jgi:hypothetical protein
MKTCLPLLLLCCSPFFAAAQDCDSIGLFTVPFDNSAGLAIYQDTFWISNSINPEPVVGLSEMGDIYTFFNVEVNASSEGGGKYHDGENLWVCHEQAGLVRIYDTPSGAVVDEFDAPTLRGGDPNTYGITMNDQFIWIAEYNLNPNKLDIFRLDRFTYASIDTFTIPDMTSLAIEYVYGSLYIPSWQTDELYIVNPFTGEVEEIRDWCIGPTNGLEFKEGILYAKTHPFLSNNRVYQMADLTSNEELPVAEPVKLFPNPTTGMVFVELPDIETTPKRVQVLDGLGRTLAVPVIPSGPGKLQINVSDLPTGMYYVQIDEEVLPLVKQ